MRMSFEPFEKKSKNRNEFDVERLKQIDQFDLRGVTREKNKTLFESMLFVVIFGLFE